MKTVERTASVLTATLLLLCACGSSDGASTETGRATHQPSPSEAAPPSTASPLATDSTTPPSEQGDVVQPLPFNASGLLMGNAQPRFPGGEAGAVSVVQVGPVDKSQGILLIAFRNNTSEGISHVDLSATARSGGQIVATGSSQGTIPDQLQPGEVGLGYIYFENSKVLSGDAEYEFDSDTLPIDTSSYNTAPLRVTEANLSGGAIVGSATNETGASLEGPFSAAVYCFDGDKLLRYVGGFAEQDGPIDANDTVTFTVDLYGDKCSSFMVGVGGYFS